MIPKSFPDLPNGRHLYPNLRGLHDLPHDLAELVLSFMICHKELEDPETATGECAHMSDRFNRFLYEHAKGSFLAVSKDWEFDDNEDGEYYITVGEALPPEVAEFYVGGPYRDAHHEFYGHTASWVNWTWFIDFTARQFSPSSPWPLIWHVRDSEGQPWGPKYEPYPEWVPEPLR